jgi:CTP-dependent riboflavin kinase
MKSSLPLFCKNPICRSLGTEFRGEESEQHTLDTGHSDFYLKSPYHRRKTLTGRIEAGSGHAGRNWGISEIQKLTGYTNLMQGTLNLRLEAEHSLRPCCILRREDRKDRIGEDLYFEYCCLVIGVCRVPALIARTSTNHWGPSVLEIMAEEMLRKGYGLQDGDTVNVEVWTETSVE